MAVPWVEDYEDPTRYFHFVNGFGYLMQITFGIFVGSNITAFYIIVTIMSAPIFILIICKI